MEKGILGVKKDPKNPMLFSFSGGDGWPSSDSEDSDYAPEASPVKPKKRRGEEGSNSRRSSPRKPLDAKKRKTGRPSKATPGSDDSTHLAVNANSTLSSDHSTIEIVVATSPQTSEPDLLKLKIGKKQSLINMTDDLDRWGRLLPSFILLKIFKTIVDADGPLPILCRVARVNRLWNDMSKQSILWRKVDLSFGWITQEERVLEQIIESKNLSQLREVNLAQWKNLTNSGIQLLADNCSMLTSIKLSGTRVNSTGLTYLVDKCPDLNSLDLSGMKTDAPHGKALHHLLESRGNKVRSLNMSYNALKNFNFTMKLIASTCSQLKVLDISNVQFTSDLVMFDIEKMQTCCTRLQILRLSNAPFRVSHASPKEQIVSPGFPDLQELDLGISGSGRGIGCEVSNNFLHRILKRSYALKLLDIRGCTSVTCESLQSLPITDLEQLFISSSSAAKYEGIEIIMTKWQHSLIVLDLSWNIYPGMSLDMAMKKLSSDPTKSKLEKLDLRGTQISCARVQSILEGCPRLNCLHLDSCRGLPRGMKKEYSGSNVVQLRQDIASLVAQAEKDEVNTTRDLCLLP